MQNKVMQKLIPLIGAITVVLIGVIIISFFSSSNTRKEQERVPMPSTTTPKEEVKHLDEAVYLNISASTTGISTYISVSTNLPDGTKMVITLKGNGYNAGDDSVYVSNGVAKTTGFTNKGAALSPGTYTVNITMVKASLQSSNVKSIIGSQGEYLKGTYAVSDGFGGSGKIVEKTSTIQIN